MAKISKAVFPVAGLGTRFLPATKANPKEMLPIVDKPLIQYAAEEAVAAGIDHLIFITSNSKRAIEDHFDSNFELHTKLVERKKYELAELVKNTLPPGIICTYVRQRDPLGLGHAILCAKPLVGDQPFAVLLADDLLDCGEQGCLSQMVTAFEKNEASIVAVQPIPKSDTQQYGIVDIDDSDSRAKPMHAIVEKPSPESAPSNLGVVGRYILTPAIFEHLATVGKGVGGEIQLTDGIAALLKSEPAYAFEFSGTRYDCGSKLGYLQATIAYGKKHPECGEAFKAWLSK